MKLEANLGRYTKLKKNCLLLPFH